MRSRTWLLVGLGIVLLLSFIPAAGGVSGAQDSRVVTLQGPNFSISGAAATADEFWPAVATNQTTNQYLVVWSDDRNLATRGSDITGQRFEADGARIGTNFRISGTMATAHDEEPAVAWNSTSGEFLVVWSDFRNYATRGSDITGQRVGPYGAPAGTNFRISGLPGTAAEGEPAAVWNPTVNQYLVVWTDSRNQATRGDDIYAQRVSADGRRIGPNLQISDIRGTGNEYHPAVAWNSTSGEFLVVWSDSRNYDTRGYDIYGQRLEADGSRIGANFPISGAAAAESELSPAVAWNPTANQYLVVWSDSRNYATRDFDIYGQRVWADGIRSGPNLRISDLRATAYEDQPAVAWNAVLNQYVIVWSDSRNHENHGYDIWGQQWEGDGGRIGANFRISGPAATMDEGFPAVAWNQTANQGLVVWEDERREATRGVDIWGERISG